MKVLVVRTNTANLASVLAALRRAGADPEVCHDADRVRRADRVVLPGVGALAAAMETLAADGMVEALRERGDAGRPLLAVCLGMQLLLEGSEESPGVPGLDIAEGTATRFTDPDILIPQLGWNRVEPDARCTLLEPGYAYFAHSYRLLEPPEGWACAYTDHGGRYVSALERGPVLGCQFHPELSDRWGQALIERWLKRC